MPPVRESVSGKLSGSLSGRERTLAALEFREADRVPRFWDSFWPEFVELWAERFGDTDVMEHFGNDMDVVVADETPWPSKACVLIESGDERIVRNGWGQVQRTRTGAHYGELLEVAIPERIDPDVIEFEDPLLDARYRPSFTAARQAEQFLFCKTGGPYMRSAFLRGEEQFWLDLKDDPEWVTAFVDRVTDHLITVGVESIHRWRMQDTGIQINDDVAANWGPMVGPDVYERVFLPPLRRMIQAYRAAGVRFIMHHADGNVLPLLDMWIDAGVDAINPVEYRSGMDAVKIREQYGNRLVLIGGLDNCEILPRGDRGEIREHIQHLMNAGRGGGYVIGPHSIGPDIDVDTMLYVLELLHEFGPYPPNAA